MCVGLTLSMWYVCTYSLVAQFCFKKGSRKNMFFFYCAEMFPWLYMKISKIYYSFDHFEESVILKTSISSLCKSKILAIISNYSSSSDLKSLNGYYPACYPAWKIWCHSTSHSCDDQICMMILSQGSETIPSGTLTNNTLASFRHLACLVTWYVNKYRCLKQKTRSINGWCQINYLNS